MTDPFAVADSARGVSLEAIVETGRHLPVDAAPVNLTEVDAETVQEEIDRLDQAQSKEYLRLSRANEAIEAGDTQLTPDDESRLERLMETLNRTEAFRIMGLELAEVSSN